MRAGWHNAKIQRSKRIPNLKDQVWCNKTMLQEIYIKQLIHISHPDICDI